MGCLICIYPERNYKSEPGKDFICSRCVQLFLSAGQEDLLKAHAKAIEKGYSNKARAIESFLFSETINVRKTKKFKRSTIRKKPMRVAKPARDKLRTKQAAI
jgi:hypothetical protein